MNINKVDELVEMARMALGAPGIAVAVVSGKDSYVQGYGVKNSEENTPVTPDTSFALASVSKAFTASALAILVDEKKLNWDDLVRKHLPGFRLQDATADSNVTVRDLVCHRTGLPRHDQLWYKTNLSRETLLARMGFLAPTASLRAKYQYNNLCFMVAGEVVRAASGSDSFESFLTERLLKPLGMKEVSFSGPGLLAAKDHATPHLLNKNGGWDVTESLDFSSVGPCGAMNASASEMLGWLQFQLGQKSKTKILSPETLQETRSAQTVIALDENFRRLYPETVLQAYGLGWTTFDYRGHELITHSGAIDGFRSVCAFCPRNGVGVCVLTNGAPSYLTATLRNLIIDHLLGLPEKDWIGIFQDQQKRDEKQEKDKKSKRRAEIVKNTKPALSLKSYVGEYKDTGYGTVKITLAKGKLHIAWESFTATLTHRHFDTFTTKSSEEAFNYQDISFTIGNDGKIASLTLWDVVFKN
jgi:CubicO group peptidase (beta-lactamase class C family)